MYNTPAAPAALAAPAAPAALVTPAAPAALARVLRVHLTLIFPLIIPELILGYRFKTSRAHGSALTSFEIDIMGIKLDAIVLITCQSLRG